MNNEERFNLNVIFEDDETKTKLQLANFENLKKALQSIWRVLNDIDKKIYIYLISQEKGINFIREGEIIVELKDIVRVVFESDSTKYYKDIEDSIKKMTDLYLYIGNKKSSCSFRLISHFKFYIENSIYKLLVQIHPYPREEILKKYTEKLHKDLLEISPNDAYKLIIYKLHRKRLLLALENEDLTMKVKYCDYFYDVLLSNNKDKYIQIIEEVLNFIKNKGCLLEEFKIVGQEISIKFRNIANKEITELNSVNILSHIEK